MNSLDTLVTLLVAVFITIEAAFLLKVLASSRNAASDCGQGMAIIRPLAFIFFMATDLSVSFIPLAMKSLDPAIPGIPRSIVLGLPISAEMLCASIGAIYGGYVIDRKGWRFSFHLGLAVLLCGALCSALATGAAVFILARGLAGLGYGFSWMAMRGYVAAGSSDGQKARGFSQLNAGIYAGNICACVLGGRLAERFGFSAVFFMAASILLLAALFSTVVKDQARPALKPVRGGSLAGFLFDPAVLSLCFLITIPSTVCLVGFVNYFFPLFASAQGYAPSSIGKAFMVYGICIIYLGPLFGRLIARDAGRIRLFLVAGSTVGAASMLVFSLSGSMAAAVATIVLLGVADSLGFVAQNTYLLSLGAVRAFGEGKALGVFSMTKKIGQMLGPMVFGWVAAVGPESGLFVVGTVYAAFLALFVLGMRRNRLAFN